MIKIVQKSDEALKVVKEISELHGIKENFDVALTGSFAQGTQKKASGLDILLKLKENGKSNLVGDMTVLSYISNFMGEHYYNKYNVLWYDLLEKDELHMLKVSPRAGLEKNPKSPYLSVVELAVWVKDEFSETEDEEINVEDFSEEDTIEVNNTVDVEDDSINIASMEESDIFEGSNVFEEDEEETEV